MAVTVSLCDLSGKATITTLRLLITTLAFVVAPLCWSRNQPTAQGRFKTEPPKLLEPFDGFCCKCGNRSNPHLIWFCPSGRRAPSRTIRWRRNPDRNYRSRCSALALSRMIRRDSRRLARWSSQPRSRP